MIFKTVIYTPIRKFRVYETYRSIFYYSAPLNALIQIYYTYNI